MDKEQLKKEQPVVYRTLSNALKQDRLAHAVLLTGPKGAPKTETAILLAQSLVCEYRDEDGFACQTCPACQRIQNEEAIDFRWIHGDKARIKKKEILELQEFFESTSVEDANRRIYFLAQFDQATPDAANSLLKFLEEPAPGIFAILSADERSNVLPTIQSRCQWIPFRPASSKRLETQFLAWTDPESAYMLAHHGYTPEKAQAALADEDFEFIHQEAKDYVMHCEEMAKILFMQRNVFVPKGDRMTKEKILWFLDWVLFYFQNGERKLSLQKQVAIREILIESMDRIQRPVELALFLDKIYNQIRKVVIS